MDHQDRPRVRKRPPLPEITMKMPNMASPAPPLVDIVPGNVHDRMRGYPPGHSGPGRPWLKRDLVPPDKKPAAPAPVEKRKAGRPVGGGKKYGRILPEQSRNPRMVLIDPKAMTERGKRIQRENPTLSPQLPIPPEPTFDPSAGGLNAMLYEDQQIARVEQLMLKGVRSARLLASALGVSEVRKVERWMVRVNARWEVAGSGVRLKRYRGEVNARIEMYRNELSIVLSNVRPDDRGLGDARAFVVCIQQLKDLDRLQMEVNGLTPNAVERLNAITDEDNEVLARIDKQKSAADMAKRFALLTGITAGLKSNQDQALAESNSDIMAEADERDVKVAHVPTHVPLAEQRSSGDDGSDATAFRDMGDTPEE